MVTTEGKFSLPSTGWYVQVLAKMPDQSQGMWPAIWFLPGVSGTPYNELDGYEGGWIGADPNETMHSDYFSDQGQQQNAYSVGADVSAGYHVYGFRFVPGQSITAYFDGRQVWQVSASNGVTITPEPYEIIIELQVATRELLGHTPCRSRPPLRPQWKLQRCRRTRRARTARPQCRAPLRPTGRDPSVNWVADRSAGPRWWYQRCSARFPSEAASPTA